MGAKWERTKQWDDRHIPAALWPVKAVLRLFSSVLFGVGLLVLVLIYGILASIPIGMLALLPTNLIYAVTFVCTVGVAAGVPLLAIWKLGLRGAPRGLRFAVLFLGGLGLAIAGGWAWNQYLWPLLRFDAALGTGLRLFAPFCEQYRATTLRRLPGMEMTELEFYSWWPLRLILFLFVTTMVVSTLRRIEFKFVNLGVLTVHTGIVTIAIGSIFYAGLKREGDTILLAGPPDASGQPTIGPAQGRFYDNIQVALYVKQLDERHSLWDQRPLTNVPRYNDYNLALSGGVTASEAAGFRPVWQADDADLNAPTDKQGATRELSIAVPPSAFGLVDPDINFRLVGYAQYAEAATDWIKADPAELQTVRLGESLNPLRIVHLYDLRTDAMKNGQAPASAEPNPLAGAKPVFAFTLLPNLPAARIADNRVLAVEYSSNMPAERWRDLSEPLPEGTRHALVVEIPASGFRGVYPITPGASVELGDTGYKLDVKQIEHEPPFPIITHGYKDSSSSVAVVHVTPPIGIGFDRWVYHRFPEISQDMLEELNERGMPKRRDADPAIRISYIDADQLQIYFDERPGGDPASQVTRAIIREPGGKVRTEANVSATGIELIPFVQMVISERWAHAEAFARPRPVAQDKRDRQFIGTHDKAMLGVEVSLASPGALSSPSFKRVVWVPFIKYLGIQDVERTLDLPDGRRLTLAFGRRQHPLPGFALQLLDFQMLAYDHRGSPRDYQSLVRVEPTGELHGPRARPIHFEAFDHITRLNTPLRAPFHWDEKRSWFPNFMGQLASGLNPNQYKFSQAGWDAGGWEQTQALTDQGVLKRPRAAFTILGVGNNPGIHIIALGAILMGVGIPWAFYVKPWLLRREKVRIQQQLKDGTYVRPNTEASSPRVPKPAKREVVTVPADSPS